MPIYEYYCPDNHTIYQFYAKTLAQAARVPICPANPKYRMEKRFSTFAVTKSGGKEEGAAGTESGAGDDPAMDARMEAAMGEMEREFSSVDENDPRAMGRMMRRMAELTGEKLDGEMEEVVRKLEEGADPESLEEQFGGEGGEGDEDAYGGGDPGSAGVTEAERRERRHRYKALRQRPARRDPKLYDFD